MPEERGRTAADYYQGTIDSDAAWSSTVRQAHPSSRYGLILWGRNVLRPLAGSDLKVINMLDYDACLLVMAHHSSRVRSNSSISTENLSKWPWPSEPTRNDVHVINSRPDAGLLT